MLENNPKLGHFIRLRKEVFFWLWKRFEIPYFLFVFENLDWSEGAYINGNFEVVHNAISKDDVKQLQEIVNKNPEFLNLKGLPLSTSLALFNKEKKKINKMVSQMQTEELHFIWLALRMQKNVANCSFKKDLVSAAKWQTGETL